MRKEPKRPVGEELDPGLPAQEPPLACTQGVGRSWIWKVCSEGDTYLPRECSGKQRREGVLKDTLVG